jgi:hypothetical protein
LREAVEVTTQVQCPGGSRSKEDQGSGNREEKEEAGSQRSYSKDRRPLTGAASHREAHGGRGRAQWQRDQGGQEGISENPVMEI